jgi:hypothetical protein
VINQNQNQQHHPINAEHMFRYAESVIASSVAAAVAQEYDFSRARNSVELGGMKCGKGFYLLIFSMKV